MWVACFGSSSLLELNVSDGSLVRSVSLASPSFLLYDGKNIWATNKAAGTITPVKASTGAVGTPLTVGTTGTAPAGMTFDGQNIWVALSGSSSQQIAKVNVTSGTVTPIPLTPNRTCVNPVGIVYYAPDPGVLIANGLSQSLWVVCNAEPIQVVELNPLSSTPGQVLAGTGNYIGPCVCDNVAFDGRYVWIATSSVPQTGAAAVQQVDTTTNSLTVTNTNLPTPSPVAVAFDGIYIWAIDGSNSNVFKVLPSAGTYSGPFTNPGGESSFLGFDGGNIWISTTDASNNTYSVSKM
jgi:hypothetical protein